MIKSQLLKLGSTVFVASLSLLSVTAIEQRLLINAPSIRVLAKTADEAIANQLYEKVNPAVVTIKTGNGHGSGFVVSKDGLVLTNAHVVDGAPSVVTVQFSDGRQVPADVIGFAKEGLDLAVLKINNPKNLTAVSLASPGSAKVGAHVFAIGTPLHSSLHNTLTQGIISRIDQKEGIIQHDAHTTQGNSGGPLLNEQGQVIGVNRAVAKSPVYDKDDDDTLTGTGLDTGIGFAISVDKVKAILVAVKQNQLSPVSTLPSPREAAPPTEISLNGQAVKGNLSQEDNVLRNGSYADAYLFQGRAGQKVTLEMNSQQFNSYLVLSRVKESDNGGELLPVAENDDKGPGSFDAQIATALPEDGVYLVYATSNQGGEVGNYSFSATATP